MIAIQDKLVSEDILDHYFLCKLDACKGACCWEGDLGAPLELDELKLIDQVLPIVKTYLSEKSIHRIETHGAYENYEGQDSFSTQLLSHGPCVFMTNDDNGIAGCAFEQAFRDGKTDFKKPISCHLYPIRVIERPEQGFTAVNYDRWDICNPACQEGKDKQLPLYQFLKEAIVRKFGEAFYEELSSAADYVKANPKS